MPFRAFIFSVGERGCNATINILCVHPDTKCEFELKFVSMNYSMTMFPIFDINHNYVSPAGDFSEKKDFCGISSLHLTSKFSKISGRLPAASAISYSKK